MFERQLPRSDMLGCVLCGSPPCTAACGRMDPGALLRSIWFDNERSAAGRLPREIPCADCSAPCEKACVRPGRVPVRGLLLRLAREVGPTLETVRKREGRLRTDLCGIPLANPFLLSSSVVSGTYDLCARAFEAGWAGASFKTVCNFDIREASPRFSALAGDNGGIVGFKNIEQLSPHSLAENMETFRRLKKNYPDRLILASVMGRCEEEWRDLARLCAENGADAVELNFSCPNMAEGGLGSDIGQAPELVERFTAAACRGTDIPVIAKLTPNVEEMNSAARAAKRGGARGISAINTVKSVMNVDPHTYVSAPAVHGRSAVGGYSGNAVKPIALRFIGELGKDPALAGMHLSAMGGIETWRDALEFILLGAGSLQVTTAVMQYGQRVIDDLKTGLELYLAEKDLAGLKEIRGLGLESLSGTTEVLERDTVFFPRFRRDRCVGCGRCEISCADGGHQAICLNGERRPVMDAKKCVGCHLCVLVCPQRAILRGGRRVKKERDRPGEDLRDGKTTD